jgi:hypothetical protein
LELKVSNYIVIPEATSADISEKRIIYSTRTSMGVMLTTYVVNLLCERQFQQLPNNIFNILMFHEIIVPEDEDELSDMVRRKVLHNETHGLQQSLLAESRYMNESGYREELQSKLHHASRDKITIVIDDRFKKEFFIQAEKSRSCLREIVTPIEPASALVVISNDVSTLVLPEWISSATVVWDINLMMDWRKGLDAFRLNISKGERSIPVTLHILFDEAILTTTESFSSMTSPVGISNLCIICGIRRQRHHSFDQWKMYEQQLIQRLKENKISLNLLPEPQTRYHVNGKQNGHKLHLENCDLILFDDDYEIMARPFFGEPWAQQLMERNTSCSRCQFLPMCGGNPHHIENVNEECPEFITAFSDRISLKYKLFHL